MIDDEIIEVIVKVGNNPEFMKMVEPNIIKPFQLQNWMVKRTLTALALIQKKEWENECTKDL